MLDLISDWSASASALGSGLAGGSSRAHDIVAAGSGATIGTGNHPRPSVATIRRDSGASHDQLACEANDRSRMVDHLKQFAQEGLRTLVCAKRELSEDQLVAWE